MRVKLDDDFSELDSALGRRKRMLTEELHCVSLPRRYNKQATDRLRMIAILISVGGRRTRYRNPLDEGSDITNSGLLTNEKHK